MLFNLHLTYTRKEDKEDCQRKIRILAAILNKPMGEAVLDAVNKRLESERW